MRVDSILEVSPFAKEVARIAKVQFDLADQRDEAELVSMIRKYWEAVGQPFPGVETAWSAVFVSFCVRQAGATRDEFSFAAAHSEFVHDAINDGTGAYKGFPLNALAPRVGDIIQNNRLGNRFDFAFARGHRNYFSHSAVVVEKGEDDRGKFVTTIGGNEDDTVGKRRVRLNADGTVAQRTASPFISVLDCQK